MYPRAPGEWNPMKTAPAHLPPPSQFTSSLTPIDAGPPWPWPLGRPPVSRNDPSSSSSWKLGIRERRRENRRSSIPSPPHQRVCLFVKGARIASLSCTNFRAYFQVPGEGNLPDSLTKIKCISRSLSDHVLTPIY